MRALICEQRARESTGPASKQDWEELAIEWHTMANLPASINDEISPTVVA
jgi:hypothetical protein